MSSDGPQGGPPVSPVLASDIEAQLNWLEEAIAQATGTDDYLAGVLQNQRILLQEFSQRGQLSGSVLDDINQREGGPLSDPERGFLPQDAIGTVARDINPGDTGPAVFQLQGTVFFSNVRSTIDEEIQAGEAVRVIEERNGVTPRGASGAASNIITSNAFRYNGQLYTVPLVADSEQTVKVANQQYDQGTRTDVDSDLDPGEDKMVAQIRPENDSFLLLKYTNATAHPTVRYDYYIDDPNDTDDDLSGAAPWASPPDLFEVVPDGFRLVEDFVELHLVETSGSSDYSNVQGALTGFIIEVR